MLDNKAYSIQPKAKNFKAIFDTYNWDATLQSIFNRSMVKQRARKQA